ncbi:MAG: divergent PAP2 family protein [Defluviitaleaceae bacterium]|nr:divergent PAP2 family protein [Defluviitaleaceae bacterium]
MRHLFTAMLATSLAQIFKVIIEYWVTRSWKKALIVSPGGMPSSHSALTVALMVSIGIYEGVNTAFFAISACLALVVMYDAAGVRRAAGEQAKAINLLFDKLEDRGLRLDKRLKELLGHRPIEVFAGALLGLMVALSVWVVF